MNKRILLPLLLLATLLLPALSVAAAYGPGAPTTAFGSYVGESQPNTTPVLSATTTDALICVGETTVVNINLADVVGLYGYQFVVSYDQTRASASGAFVESFFDVSSNVIIPGGWNADCTTSPGTCKFAVSKQAPATPVSGSGTLTRITLTGVEPGVFNMAFSSDVLSDIDGLALAHTLAAPLTITVCGYATVSGFVTMQGRPGNNVDAGTVSLTELDDPAHFSSVVPVSFSASDGAYSITVPVLPGGSHYRLSAAHGLYLTNAQDYPSLTPTLIYGENTRLWGGDADNDGDVTIFDLTCIAGAFGEEPVSSVCGTTGSPDINADGRVNIQDLSLTGGNFDKCGVQPWAWMTAPPVYCGP